MASKNFFIKLFSYLLLFLLFFNFYASFADDIDISSDNVNVEDEITLETSNNDVSNLTLNSRSCIILDRLSKKVLYGKNEYNKVKMASTTKIMTASVIIEQCDLNQTIEVSKKAANTGGSRLGLKVGDKITIRDLLYGLLLSSGNDAAVALAETARWKYFGF